MLTFWAWAMIMIQLAMGRAPLEARTDVGSSRLLLEAVGLGKCKHFIHSRSDTTSQAMYAWPGDNMGYFRGSSLRYVLVRCLSWSPESRPKATVIVQACRLQAAACPHPSAS